MIGIEISSARCRPLLTSCVIALSSEPLPASSMVTPGCRAATPSTNCATCAARVSGLLGSPRRVTTTSAVRPPARERSGERSGPSTDATTASRRAPASSACTACAVRRGLLERTRTFSVAGPLRPEAVRRASARADSPVPEPEFESVRMPALEPRNTHATISASQSATVVLGRRAALRAAAWTKRESTPAPRGAPEPADPFEPADPPDTVDEGVICMASETAFGGLRNRWGGRASGGLRTPALDGGEIPTSRRSRPGVQLAKSPPSPIPWRDKRL